MAKDKKTNKIGNGIKEAIFKRQRRDDDLYLADEARDILALDLNNINFYFL